MRTIEVRSDQRRGCGWRKPGGLYLVSGGEGRPCCKLPIALEVCPACGGGIKFCRSWTWIDSDKLFPEIKCSAKDGGITCPLSGVKLGKMGLLWVGESFYKTPAEFTEEAARLGISRRIPAIPREFVLGETWVAFAHRKCIPKECPDCGAQLGTARPHIQQSENCETCGGDQYHAAGIFRIFKPEAIEYVVTGKETDEELDALAKRGITPVRVERIGDTGELGIQENGEGDENGH